MSLVIFFNSAFLYILYGIVAFSLLLVLWMKWTYTYWERLGIVTPPVSLFYGNLKNTVLQKESFYDLMRFLYKTFQEKGLKHGGIYLFHSPYYIPVDVKIIKSIMQNDFNSFINRGVYINEKRDPLSLNLFGLEGAKWKDQRSKTTPMFTAVKMKMMFEIAIKSGDHLQEALMDLVLEKRTPLEFKTIARQYTVDIVGNVVYGMNQNSFKDPDNEMVKSGKRFFALTKWENFKRIVAVVTPSIARFFDLKVYPKEVDDYFLKLTDHLMEHRWQNKISKPDFMDMLIQLQRRGGIDVKDENKANVEPSLSFEELASQAFIFFTSNESVSSAVSLGLYLLAKHPNIQDRLRKQIHECLEETNGIVTYDAMMKMDYLDQCVDETLRMYPPIPSAMRSCIKDYKIPDTDMVLQKGVHVLIPIAGIHFDPEHYPDPEVFDPDRFLKENQEKRHPFSYMPFGMGPRGCIAKRFGRMQVKIALISVINKFNVFVDKKTIEPLTTDPEEQHTNALGGVWLNLEPIKKFQ